MILKGASPLNYEQLLTTADQNDLVVKEQPLTDHDGLLRGKRIAIRKDIETQAEKSCVLAEEIGHHCTSGRLYILTRKYLISMHNQRLQGNAAKLHSITYGNKD